MSLSHQKDLSDQILECPSCGNLAMHYNKGDSKMADGFEIKNICRWLCDKCGEELYDLGILTVLDLPAFEMYCDLYSRWYNAYADKKVAYAKEARMFMNEFGMTPSARTKIHVKERDDSGGMKALLEENASYS